MKVRGCGGAGVRGCGGRRCGGPKARATPHRVATGRDDRGRTEGDHDARRRCEVLRLKACRAEAGTAKADVPTTIIVGDEDIITPPSDASVMHQLIEGSMLVSLARRATPAFVAT